MALKKTIASYFKEVQIEIFENVVIPQFNEAGEKVGETNHQQKRANQVHRIEVPQLDVDMHPLEEAEILAKWAIGDVKLKMPRPIAKEDEHELMIEHGPEYVKQKRTEWQALTDSFKPELDEAIAKHQEASAAYMKWASSEEGVAHHHAVRTTHENATLDSFMGSLGFAKNPPAEEAANAVT